MLGFLAQDGALNRNIGTSLAVQGLRLHASIAGGSGSIPGPTCHWARPKRKKKITYYVCGGCFINRNTKETGWIRQQLASSSFYLHFDSSANPRTHPNSKLPCFPTMILWRKGQGGMHHCAILGCVSTIEKS